MKRKFIIITLVLALIPFLVGSTSYNYSFHETVLNSSPGLNYATHFNQSIIGIPYAEARDFVVYDDHIYMVAAAPVSDSYSDYLIILDKEYQPIADMPLKEFELSSSYMTKVRGMIGELFEEIKEGYNNLFQDNVIYPGTQIPLGNKDPFIGVADAEWNILDESIITSNGTLINNTNDLITTTIEGTFSIWSDEEITLDEETITLTFEVTIGTNVAGIMATGTSLNPRYELENDALITDINRILGTEINEGLYDTIGDYIEGTDETAEPTTDVEVTDDNFKINYSKVLTEEGETEFSKIVFTEIVELELMDIHSSLFQVPYTLNTASGIDVVDSGIYIADRRNNRIVKLNHQFEVLDAFFEIDDPTFDLFAFEPLKVTVDPSERMNVVAHNVYEGILELDSDGSFNRYTGVNPIKLTPAETLRRLLMTEAQRSKLQRFLPTQYTNVTLDDRNFIYATAQAREENDENMIQLINPKGVDVLVRNGYFPPKGDVHYVKTRNTATDVIGPSQLVDIAIGKAGMYTVLDQKRSRLFTYDAEGNLLYVNGSDGDQSDKFTRGIAINYVGDDLVLLDATGTMIVYRPTAFGEAVNEAVRLHDIGEFELAAGQWEEVLKLNTNYEIAYNGIGKYNLRQGDYKKAMENFKLGHDTYYYSKAFTAYRNEIIKDNFAFIILGIVVLSGGYIVFTNRQKIFKKGKDEA